jgi:hypothetical protein
MSNKQLKTKDSNKQGYQKGKTNIKVKNLLCLTIENLSLRML